MKNIKDLVHSIPLFKVEENPEVARNNNVPLNGNPKKDNSDDHDKDDIASKNMKKPDPADLVRLQSFSADIVRLQSFSDDTEIYERPYSNYGTSNYDKDKTDISSTDSPEKGNESPTSSSPGSAISPSNNLSLTKISHTITPLEDKHEKNILNDLKISMSKIVDQVITTEKEKKAEDEEDVTFGGLEGFDKLDMSKDPWHQYFKFLFCHFGILCLLVSYTIAGAFVFVALEHPYERDVKFNSRLKILEKEKEIYELFRKSNLISSTSTLKETKLGSTASSFVDTYDPNLSQKRIGNGFNKDYESKPDYHNSKKFKRQVKKNDTKFVVRTRNPFDNTLISALDDWALNDSIKKINISTKLTEYATLLLNNAKHFEIQNHIIVMKPFQWTLTKAMFFSATVISTIGYGNITPETLYGRIFCMIYAVFGIPLLLLVVADLGTLFAKLIHFLWVKFSSTVEKNAVSVLRMGNNELRKITKRIKVPKRNLKLPIYAALLLMGLYMAAGAGSFLLWEDWTFFDSFYFVFITMTTIGFGDIVPVHTNYLLLMMVYILVGLATMTTCVELVIHTYLDKLKELRNRVKFVTEKTEETLRNETLKKYLQNPEIMNRVKKIKLNKAKKERKKTRVDSQTPEPTPSPEIMMDNV
ncbi:unnamed protein product [Gordionus sp. m RMFG-2023]|uniref:uncharacterized protein LOC135927746 isoform X2 n=1 Tax=Gordionus sp. m RMFG-2023 TaxID=3053472 RepID=UPI0030E12EE5